MAGQAINGAMLSTTVIVKLQKTAAELDSKSEMIGSEHVTVVMPTGKNEPGEGLQMIAGQLPDVVGRG